MTKQHLKRLASPNSWAIKKKGIKFTTRPNPGPHKIDYQMPINVVLRDVISVVQTTKEAKFLLHSNDCLIDGNKCYDYRRPAGLMDVVTIPSRKESFRILINKKNKLYAVKVDEKEATTKLVKIKSKTSLKGNKSQLNCTDGRNILIDKVKDYKINDSLLIELPSQKIKEKISFEKGAIVLLISGAHVGQVGKIEEIKEASLVVKTDEKTFTTKRKYAFVVGKSKPVLKL